MPLDEFEEALLVAAGTGISGIPLWDGSRPPAVRAGNGRTFGSTTHGRRTALFFTNDRGVFVIDPADVTAIKLTEIETRDERQRILAHYRQHRKQLSNGRLAIPRQVPPLFGHNMWNCNMPGTTLFMPVMRRKPGVDLVDFEFGRLQSQLWPIHRDRNGYTDHTITLAITLGTSP